MNIIKTREELSKGKTIYDMPLRVVYYARVSTEKDEQLNSLYNQSKYFEDMINEVDNWTFIDSYIDEGISGTGVNNRKSFLKMIADGSSGMFDLVLTKEVSRFARNTIDSIKYTQTLLTKGVIVNFISDNINTIFPDSEFRLALMASLAQDEVRKLSERVKFGMKRSVKEGRLLGGNITGYKKKECKLEINEKEAKMIELLFELYATGKYGFRLISEKLMEKGYYNSIGKPHNANTLKRIIQNPRYKGYYTANKSYIEDYKTHKKVRLPISDWICYKDSNIPAIVSEELWNKANEILNSRIKKTNSNILNKQWYLDKRKYTSKLICSIHNTTFIRIANGERKKNPVWVCNEYLRRGLKACLTPILYEKKLDKIFIKILDNFSNNNKKLLENMIKDYKLAIMNVNKRENLNDLVQKINYKEKMKDKLLELNVENSLSNKEFKEKNEKLNSEISFLRQKLSEKRNINDGVTYYEQQIGIIKKALKPKLDIENNFNYLLDLLIDKVYVSKINGDRKHVKLQIVYKLSKEEDIIEIDFNKKNSNSKRKIVNSGDIINNKNYLLFDNNRSRS